MPTPKKGADVKPHVICFRLTAAEKELLDAQRGGMSAGEWARRFVIRGIQPVRSLSIGAPMMTQSDVDSLVRSQDITLEERIIRGEEGQ